MSHPIEDVVLGRSAALHSLARSKDPGDRIASASGIDRSEVRAGAAAARRCLGKLDPASEGSDIYARREALVRERAARLADTILPEETPAHA